MSLPLTYVTPGAWGAGVGRPLAAAEADGNFWVIASTLLAALETIPAAAVGIAEVSLTDTVVTVTGTDGSQLGQFALPVPGVRGRGPWAAATGYLAGDVVAYRGVCALATADHAASADWWADYRAGRWRVVAGAACPSPTALSPAAAATSGEAVLEVPAGLALAAGMAVTAQAEADATARIVGTVAAYAAGGDGRWWLTLTVTGAEGGSATRTGWVVTTGGSGGGGGLQHLTEARAASGVTLAQPVVSLSAAGSDAVALSPGGNAPLLARVPDGMLAGGNARGSRATDWQRTRTAADRVASGAESTIGGGHDNQASGEAATVAGGTRNRATATRATVGGGANNLASGSQAAIGGGDSNTASGDDSAIGGGYSNTASGMQSVVAGGSTNSATQMAAVVGGGLSNTAGAAGAVVGGGMGNGASGSQAVVAGGSGNTAGGLRAVVGGGLNNAAGGEAAVIAGGSGNAAAGTAAAVTGGSGNTADAPGSRAGGIAAHTRGLTGCDAWGSGGHGQVRRVVLLGQTYDDSPVVLTADGFDPAPAGMPTLPANACAVVRARIAALRTDAAGAAGWEVSAVLQSGAAAGSTVLVGTPVVTALGATDPAWSVAVGTGGGWWLELTVTGGATAELRWSAAVEILEVAA